MTVTSEAEWRMVWLWLLSLAWLASQVTRIWCCTAALCSSVIGLERGHCWKERQSGMLSDVPPTTGTALTQTSSMQLMEHDVFNSSTAGKQQDMHSATTQFFSRLCESLDFTQI